MNPYMEAMVVAKATDISGEKFELLQRTLVIPNKEHPGEYVKLYSYDKENHTIILPRSMAHLFPNLEMRTQLGRPLSLPPSQFKPRKGQEVCVSNTVDYLKQNGGGLLEAKCGGGKALAHGEPVLTSYGWMPIDNVCVGDMAAGTDGKFYRVEGVFPQGIRDLYEVTFTDGTVVKCDGDHIWKMELRRKSGQPVTELTTLDMMKEGLRHSSGRTYWLPQCSRFPDIYPEVDLPVDPYTLGALLGDGHMSTPNTLMFTTMDGPEIFSRMKFPPLTRPKVLTHQNAGKATTFLIAPPLNAGAEVRLPDQLREMKLEGCTSHTKFIPYRYLCTTAENRLALLQGLLDTDGSVAGSGAVEYSSASKDLAEGVVEIVRSLGGIAKIKGRWTTCEGEKFFSYRVTIWMPEESPPFSLPRKRDSMETAKQRRIGRAVESIKAVGKGEATCISVASPDHMFITRGYVPTHNTVMGAEVILRLGRPTCVLVHKHFLAEQWRKAFHGDPETGFPGLCPAAKIGYIASDNCDTGDDYDIVIATVQSIVNPKREYPREMYKSFGFLVMDETHRYGAELWQNAIAKFPAHYRLGLTAEAYRADGMMPVIWNHVGKTAAILDDGEKTTCKVHFVNLPTQINSAVYIQRWDGKVNRARLISALAKSSARNEVIIRMLRKAVESGRKIMVLSERREQLQTIALALEALKFTDVGFYVGGKKQEQLDEAAKKKIVLATYQMAQEGLDIPDLDTLFLATPMVRITQSVGRILRKHDGKKEPMVVDFVDQEIGICTGMKGARKKLYIGLGYQVQ